jgi:putative ABC transport system permease protein
MLRLLPLVLRNVLRNRRRSLLTLASSAISLALLALLIAIYQGFFYAEDSSPSEARRIIVRHRVSLTQTLPASHQARIDSVPGVEVSSAWTWFQGKYKDEKPENFFARFAVDADRIFKLRQDWIASPEQVKAFEKSRTACAIGEKIANRLNIKIGDRVNIKGDIYPVDPELTVTTIFQHPPNTEALIFHREYLTELQSKSSASRDTVGTFALLASTPDQVPRISKAIDTMFENDPAPTRTESEKEFGRSFLAFLGNIKLFLAAICGAVTFTILLVSANTVAMSVRERTRELAILRTLGYAPGEFLALVLAEAVVISLLGGAIGIGIGALLSKAAAAGSGGFPVPGVKWQAVVIVMSMAAVIGLLAALVPAVSASRKNVVESLRFVG